MSKVSAKLREHYNTVSFFNGSVVIFDISFHKTALGADLGDRGRNALRANRVLSHILKWNGTYWDSSARTLKKNGHAPMNGTGLQSAT